jgi:hypothetical protein
MLLFLQLRLEFDFRVAGENISAFQISGKSGGSLRVFSESRREPAGCRIRDSKLADNSDAH